MPNCIRNQKCWPTASRKYAEGTYLPNFQLVPLNVTNSGYFTPTTVWYVTWETRALLDSTRPHFWRPATPAAHCHGRPIHYCRKLIGSGSNKHNPSAKLGQSLRRTTRAPGHPIRQRVEVEIPYRRKLIERQITEILTSLIAHSKTQRRTAMQ